jgi:hypothetical protein
LSRFALKYVYTLPDVVYLQKNNSVGWTPVHYAAYEGISKKRDLKIKHLYKILPIDNTNIVSL